MSLTKRQIESISKKLLKKTLAPKLEVIKKIQKIIKPHLYDSGYVDLPKSGILPKGEKKKSLKIVKLPKNIYIPEVLINQNEALRHGSEDGITLYSSYSSMDGLNTDVHSFTDYKIFSLELLEVLLIQIEDMYSN